MRIDDLGGHYLGKALGMAAGLLLAPESADVLWLASAAIVGILVGHAFDVAFAAHQSQAAHQHNSSQRDRAQQEFLFAGMGHLAKCSGRVRRSHIEFVERAIARGGLSAAARSQAIQWFNAGKRPGFGFAQLGRTAFGPGAEPELAQARAIMTCFVGIGAVANSDSVTAGLSRMATYMNLSKSEVAGMIAQANPSSPPPPVASEPKPAAPLWAYQRLEVSPQASQAEIKRAYRRLVARYHPDRLGKRASKAEIERSNARMHDIREAFDALQK